MRRGRAVGRSRTAHVTSGDGDGWRGHALEAVVDVLAVAAAVLSGLVDGQEAGGSSETVVTRSGSLQQRPWRWARIVVVSGPVGARLVKHVLVVSGLRRSVGIAEILSRVRGLMRIVRRVPGGGRRRGGVGHAGARAVLLVHRERVVVVRHHSSITFQSTLHFPTQIVCRITAESPSATEITFTTATRALINLFELIDHLTVLQLVVK